MWINRLKELLGKSIINQEDYDEFIRIGKTLKTDDELDIYQQIGDGIYQKTRGTNIKLTPDEFWQLQIMLINQEY